ncbi:TPA: hypothetical protein HJO85_001219 [Escherichia coli]|nr:hypothetical protein [Escherichia coli]MBB0824442.1 hypothetical protein [Escherichia coli]HAI4538714.1 hypothetical protein [Escherichia coli]HAZ7262865.1 hypothetical protein [Escherichia coli]HAZ8507392.1 hypothetical protein [Escherichia coli]
MQHVGEPEQTNKEHYSGDANLTDEQIAKLPFALYRQGYEYYWKTHAHPNIFRSVRDIVPSKRWLL